MTQNYRKFVIDMKDETGESLILIPVALGLLMFLIVCLTIFKQIYDSGKIEIRDNEVELGVDYEIIQEHNGDSEK